MEQRIGENPGKGNGREIRPRTAFQVILPKCRAENGRRQDGIGFPVRKFDGWW